MKKPTILVTGADGQLGSEIKKLSKTLSHYSFIFIDKKDVDLTDESAFTSYASHLHISYLINCAAYTAVDLAEKEIQLASLVNERAPEILALYCKERNVRMIHISTDYVFDGNGNSPISEDSVPNPLSVYGITKLNGEKKVQTILPNAYVIRTAWVYSSFGKNFLKTMLSLGEQRSELNVVYDQIGSPTCAVDLANAILAIVDAVEKGVDFPGVYNYSNEGVISWYDFAIEIIRRANLKCKVTPILSHEFPTAAKRPTFSVLNKSKIKKIFNITIPHWTESLQKTINELTTPI